VFPVETRVNRQDLFDAATEFSAFGRRRWEEVDKFRRD
jgi:hypothetical protein